MKIYVADSLLFGNLEYLKIELPSVIITSTPHGLEIIESSTTVTWSKKGEGSGHLSGYSKDPREVIIKALNEAFRDKGRFELEISQVAWDLLRYKQEGEKGTMESIEILDTPGEDKTPLGRIINFLGKVQKVYNKAVR